MATVGGGTGAETPAALAAANRAAARSAFALALLRRASAFSVYDLWSNTPSRGLLE